MKKKTRLHAHRTSNAATKQSQREPLSNASAQDPTFAGFDRAFGQAICNAKMDFDPAPGDQTLDTAKDMFCQHWPEVRHSVLTILELRNRCATATLLEEIELLLSSIRFTLQTGGPTEREGGLFLYQVAQAFCRDIAEGMATEAPSPNWLVELAATEFIVPSLMIGGKLAPVFTEWNQRLRWGNSILKQGKSQFDASQTMAVATALRIVEENRRSALLQLEYHARSAHPRMHEKDLERCKVAAALPPLSQATKRQWWPVVRDIVRHGARLTPRERENLAARDSTRSERFVLNEYVNRCKKAFDCLCPTE